MALLLCVAAATIVAAEPGVADNLDQPAILFAVSDNTDAVLGAQRSLLQTTPAPVYSSPKPCALAVLPNSNTYTVTITTPKNWGFGRDALVSATRAVYRSAAYKLNTYAIVVTGPSTGAATVCATRRAARRVAVTRNGRIVRDSRGRIVYRTIPAVCLVYRHRYKVVVPLRPCSSQKALLRNALKAAMRNIRRSATGIRSLVVA